METVVNKIENSLVEIEVKVEEDVWKEAQNKALKKLAKDVKIDGFRKGKAPLQLVKNKINKQLLLEEALDDVLKDCYSEVITANEIAPVSQPEVAVTKMSADELEFKVTATVKPDVELGQYKGLNVVRDEVEVTDEDVNNKLEDYQKQFSELVVKDEDGVVEDGDTVILDYQGLKDGVAFDGGSAVDQSLVIGSGTFIPGFEEGMIGMKVGEEKDIELTFPADYHVEDLADAVVVFHVQVNEISYSVLPEIDDELAKDVSIDGVETLEDLKLHITEEIKIAKDRDADEKFDDDVYELLMENTPIDIPEVMIDSEVEMMINNISQSMGAQGVTLDQYFELTGASMDDLKSAQRPQAEKRVHLRLILEAIVKAENIDVTDEEIDKELEDIASYYGQEVEQVKTLLGNEMDTLIMDIAVDKASALVKESCQPE